MSSLSRRQKKLERHRQKRKAKRQRLQAQALQASSGLTLGALGRPPVMRMSEALEIVAAPLIEELPESCTERDVEAVFIAAATAWNLSLLDPTEAKTRELRESLPNSAEVIDELIERKQLLFAFDRRMVLGVQTTRTATGFYTQALSAY